ncbi:MAG: hypothetical protein ACJA1N_001658 [Saprospiraceae bacterium]|jgi:hypothetical protein
MTYVVNIEIMMIDYFHFLNENLFRNLKLFRRDRKVEYAEYAEKNRLFFL